IASTAITITTSPRWIGDDGPVEELDEPPVVSRPPSGWREPPGGIDEVGMVWVVVVGPLVVAVLSASACAGGTPVQAWAPGAPRPGVGSKDTHPAWLIQTSGHAWALRPRTM